MQPVDHLNFNRGNTAFPVLDRFLLPSRHCFASVLTASAIAVLAMLSSSAWAGGDGGGGGITTLGSGPAGAPGNMATGAGGSGGGAGGSAGTVGGLLVSGSSTTISSGTLAGGNGGNGADSPNGGGGGGGGGEGLVAGTGTVTNLGTIRGGNGGNAGKGVAVGARSGGGGGGGAGLSTSGNVINSGSIVGGNGGATAPNDSGAGGAGAGVLATGATILNNFGASIMGGTGGTGTLVFVNGAGTGGTGAGGAEGGNLLNPGGGDGAVGILGANLTVINKGLISGGGPWSANAITFSGGSNRLELRPGFSFIGGVLANGNDVLALGSEVGDNGSISLPSLGTPNYTGFNQYEKTGPGNWTVSGAQANSATAGWKLVDGKLNLDTGASLGAVTLVGGSLTGNGTMAQLIGGPGTVAPGNSVGQLVVTGTTTLAGATYAAEIDPGNSNADLLVVNGADLTGGTLTVTSLNGAPAVGQTFTVMRGTGIVGVFGSVVYTDSFPGVTPSVQYSETDVQVVYAAATVVTPGKATPVPTISQWGLVLLALALGWLAWRKQNI